MKEANMSIQTLSDNARCVTYASCVTAVPRGFNMPKNRLNIGLYAFSDTTQCCVGLYEYHGLFWYSLLFSDSKNLNSVGFVSLQNCVAGLRDTLRCLGFTLPDSDSLTRFVRAWNRQGRSAA